MLNIFEDSFTKWRRALQEPLQAEDRLEYYETRFLDPTIDLSESDKIQIDAWMSVSESLSDSSEDPMSTLTPSEKNLVEHWMQKSENLPLNVEVGPATPFDYIESLIDRVTARYYRWYYGLRPEDFKVSPEERRQS